MLTLLLLTWLSCPATCQEWCWDEVTNATYYRVYWSESPTEWCEQDYVTVTNGACVGGECCDSGAAVYVHSPVLYYNVQSYNDNGECEWEHGERVECLEEDE